MITTWKYSLDSEAVRVVNTANQMVTGFFRLNNFLVLPYPQKRLSPQVVTFPDMPYNTVSRFWDKVKAKDIFSMPPTVNGVAEMVFKLLKQRGLEQPDYQKTQTDWEKANAEVLESIYKVIPTKKGILNKLVIYPTVIGTTCSFSDITPQGELYVFLRSDQGIFAIVEAIVTELTRRDVFMDLSGSWSESELLVDYLLTKSSICEVVKKYSPNDRFEPTMRSIRSKQNATILKKSDEFYRKLGLPETNNVFGLKGNHPMVFDKPLKNLTETEKTILKLLIKKANDITTFDELSEAIYDTEDDFSLYAITKSMQRVRNKLEENGVSGSFIQTLRGRGYLLKN